MLAYAQVAVGIGELNRVLSAHVPTPGERVQCAQGASFADSLVCSPVHHLEQLDGELNIAQSPATKLEIPVRIGPGKHAGAHRASVLNKPLTRRSLPHERRREALKLRTESGVSRACAGFQQRLELPRMSPFSIVLGIRFERSHELAVTPLRPQVGVNLPQASLRCPFRAHARDLTREGTANGGDLFLTHAATSGFSDIHDVNI